MTGSYPVGSKGFQHLYTLKVFKDTGCNEGHVMNDMALTHTGKRNRASIASCQARKWDKARLVSARLPAAPVNFSVLCNSLDSDRMWQRSLHIVGESPVSTASADIPCMCISGRFQEELFSGQVPSEVNKHTAKCDICHLPTPSPSIFRQFLSWKVSYK